MSVIIYYVFFAAESESDISFAPSRLDFAACEVTIFGKQQKMKKLFSRNNGQLTYFLSFLMYFSARNTIKSLVFAKNIYFFIFSYFLFWKKKILLKSENLKSRHDGVFLMLFSDSLSKNTQKNIQVIVIDHLRSKFFFRFSIEMQKSIVPVQPNLDVMRQNGCQIQIQRPKKHRK